MKLIDPTGAVVDLNVTMKAYQVVLRYRGYRLPGGELVDAPAEPEAQEPEAVEELSPLAAMTKGELVEMAEALGLKTKGVVKADLISAIETTQE